jgi:hypothetical protein
MIQNKELHEQIVLILESNNFEFMVNTDGHTQTYYYSDMNSSEKIYAIIEEDCSVVLEWVGHYEVYIDNNISETLLNELNKILI